MEILMKVLLRNKTTNERAEVQVGWSWGLYLFAGLGYPLFKRKLHRLGAAAMAMNIATAITFVVICAFSYELSTVQGLIIFETGAIVMGAALFFGAKGNELHGKSLLQNGWEFADRDALAAQYARQQWGVTA